MKKLTFTINYVYKSKEVTKSRPFYCTKWRDAFTSFFNAVDVLRQLPNSDVVELHLSRHHAGHETTVIIGYPAYDCKVWDYDAYNFCPSPMLY